MEKKCVYFMLCIILFLMGNECYAGSVKINTNYFKRGNSVVIRGLVPNLLTGEQDWKTLDSCKIESDTYKYKYKKLKVPMLAYIMVYDENASAKEVYLKIKNITFRDAFLGNIILDNSDLQINVYKYDKGAFRAESKGSLETEVKLILEGDEMLEALDNTHTHKRKYIDDSGVLMNDSLIRQYPSSQILLEHISDYRSRYLDLNILENQFNAFSTNIRNSEAGHDLFAYINAKKQNISATFKFYDTMGKPYGFKEAMQGKSSCLFIFWASWCSPCRQEIPELKKLYETYKDQIAFVSISADKSRQAWLEAVKQENMPWLNLASFPEDGKKVINYWGIVLMPAFVIIDAKGNMLVNTIPGFYVNGKKKKYGTLEDIETFLKD